MTQPLRKGIWQYLAKFRMCLLFDSEILLLRIYTNTHGHMKRYIVRVIQCSMRYDHKGLEIIHMSSIKELVE